MKYYILYGKGPTHKRFRPIDCTTGERQINYLNVTVFDESEAQAIREDFAQMHEENLGWRFQLRYRFSMDEKKLDEAVQTVIGTKDEINDYIGEAVEAAKDEPTTAASAYGLDKERNQ